MSMPSVIIESTLKPSDVCAIHVTGRFDRQSSSELFAALKTAITDESREIEIDLGDVSYIDGAALGMMFTLRDKAKAAGKTVCVVY